MTDRSDPAAENVGLPMQPSGSGVADLEVAYEQMKLVQAERDEASMTRDEVETAATTSDFAESEAHPS